MLEACNLNNPTQTKCRVGYGNHLSDQRVEDTRQTIQRINK
jgi:hypothetical protein